MTRFTLTDDGRLVAHGSLGERDLQPDEIEQLRQALETKPLPAWFDLGVVAAGLAALAYWSLGISNNGGMGS